MPCNVYGSVCSRGEGRLDSRIGLPVWFVHRAAKEAALTVPRQVDQALVFVRVEARPGTQGDQRNQHPSCWGTSKGCTEEVSFELSPAGKQSPVPPRSGCAGHMAAAWSLEDSWLWVCHLQVMLKGMALSDCPLQLIYLICSQVLGELCFRGYLDTVRFLEENGTYGRATEEPL